jgi:thiamine biosynthesis lipoprotein
MDTLADKQSRRSFLRMSALLSLGTAASSLFPAKDASAFLFGKKEHKISKTRLVMGTYVNITAIHSSVDQAEEAIAIAYEEIDRLNGLLSRHLSTTPLAELNRSGKLADADPELIHLIEQSLFYYSDTSGAFDVTVLPLLNLYSSSFSAGTPPSGKQVVEALSLVGTDNVAITGRDITLMRQGMGITLDGIAKGYIVDRASEVLLAYGIKNHLINGGGDIRTHGNGAKGKPWTIAVQDPAKGGKYPEIIKMNNGAVATSGNYEIFYDSEKLYHHIVNGKTGWSPLLSKSVTVSAPTVMAADALSTSVFVLEPIGGVKYVNSRPGIECLVVDKDDVVHRSQGWA